MRVCVYGCLYWLVWLHTCDSSVHHHQYLSPVFLSTPTLVARLFLLFPWSCIDSLGQLSERVAVFPALGFALALPSVLSYGLNTLHDLQSHCVSVCLVSGVFQSVRFSHYMTDCHSVCLRLCHHPCTRHAILHISRLSLHFHRP